MKAKMTHATRAELTNAIRSRYSKSSGKAKRTILEEFIAATGYHEKSAIRALDSIPSVKDRQKRQRPSLYDEAARAAVIVLWEASDRVCGKRLKPLVPILLPALERHGHLKLNEEIRVKVTWSAAIALIDFVLSVAHSGRVEQRKKLSSASRKRSTCRGN